MPSAIPQRTRRRRAGLIALCLALGATVALVGTQGSRPTSSVRRAGAGAHSPGRAAGPRPAREHPPAARDATRHRRHAQGPPTGSLPQTHVLPSSTSPRFTQLTSELWRGVVRNSLDTALPAFFPRAAYVQVKAIGSPSLDWSGRLVHDYRLDLAAANSLLGRPLGARLIRVDAPARSAHWVAPGACYNRVGYYELPNARVVYREDGQTRSFGIASMISWRGAWYVVHLGAVVRSGGSGIVDEPLAGPGVSRPSAIC